MQEKYKVKVLKKNHKRNLIKINAHAKSILNKNKPV